MPQRVVDILVTTPGVFSKLLTNSKSLTGDIYACTSALCMHSLHNVHIIVEHCVHFMLTCTVCLIKSLTLIGFCLQTVVHTVAVAINCQDDIADTWPAEN